jgi:hypothetical protein
VRLRAALPKIMLVKVATKKKRHRKSLRCSKETIERVHVVYHESKS